MFRTLLLHLQGVHQSLHKSIRVEHGFKDIGLYDTSSIASDVLWYIN
jgi:hypothetical protein